MSKRLEILGVARELSDRGGAAAVTMRQVASNSSLSLAGLMHYFKSRESLLIALQGQGDNSFYHICSAAAGRLTPGEIVSLAVLDRRCMPGAGSVYLSLVSMAVRQPGHAAAVYLRERLEWMRRSIAECISKRDKVNEGSLARTPDVAAEVILAMAEGIWLQSKYMPYANIHEYISDRCDQLLAI
ncbi:TetR/AcrR family transcriptional regulator [Mycobacteroides abscessus]|uniref:TetR/AcrR family transcriptional regulator n=1 Tax=Mycobacteroides abscessus TaxID=36809 RepID=UPI0009A938B6|nr:TetR/AcrR family transcriptional regulator [Mycobacteroides abscessus]